MKQYNVSKKIYKLRIQKKWSERQLAENVNLSQSTINDIENGKNKLKKIDTVYKFLDTFNVSFDFLFREYLIVFKNKKSKKSDLDTQIEEGLFQMSIENLKLFDSILESIIKYQKNK